MRQDEKGFGNRCICSGDPDDRYQHYNHGAWRGRHGQTPYRVIENKPPAEYLAGGFLFPAEGYKGPILALAAWQKGRMEKNLRFLLVLFWKMQYTMI